MECIPTLYPSAEEFMEPITYLSQPQVYRLGHTFGMIKIVPPEEFKPPLSINEDTFRFRTRLQTLHELNILNRARLFFMKQVNNFNLAGRKKKSAQLAKPYAENEGTRVFYYDLFIEVVKYFSKTSDDDNLSSRKRSRSRTMNATTDRSAQILMKPLRDIISDNKMWKSVSKTLNCPAHYARELFEEHISTYYNFLQRESERFGNDSAFLSSLIYNEEYPASLLNDNYAQEESEEGVEDDEEEEGCVICDRNTHRSKTILCDSCDRPFHLFCLNPPLVDVPKGKWVCNNCIVGNGYYGFQEDDSHYSRQQFKQMCRDFDSKIWAKGEKPKDIYELECMFWERVDNIDLPCTVKYGADIHNEAPGEVTGFPTKDYVPPTICASPESLNEYGWYTQHPMNLINLPYAKGSLLALFGRRISGMTVPWIYIGSTFSTFCWHLEDQYTLSANYQHEGDPKVWYSIPEHGCEKFNHLMQQIAPDLFEKQPDLLHQLVTLIAPYDKRFQEANIPCYKAIQHPGEYIVTFPKCYHSGFNTGYNFNEAVNFTINLWLPYGVEATHDYVRSRKQCVFDMWELMLNILVEYLRESKKFDEALVRRCYSEILEVFNSELKIVDYLSHVLSTERLATGVVRQHMDDKTEVNLKITVDRDVNGYSNNDSSTDDSDDEGDDDIFCSQCKTICPFAFIVHYKNSRLNKRRHLQEVTPSQWNKMSQRGDLSIYCLKDYMEVIEKAETTAELDTSLHSLKNFTGDELYYIRKPDEIKEILKKAQFKIDSLKR